MRSAAQPSSVASAGGGGAGGSVAKGIRDEIAQKRARMGTPGR